MLLRIAWKGHAGVARTRGVWSSQHPRPLHTGSSSTTEDVVDTVHTIDEASRLVSSPDPKTSLPMRPVWD